MHTYLLSVSLSRIRAIEPVMRATRAAVIEGSHGVPALSSGPGDEPVRVAESADAPGWFQRLPARP
ncbi:MAG: hypothetical protein ACREN2_04185 [Candidatus Dormibacteria bacterium]